MSGSARWVGRVGRVRGGLVGRVGPVGRPGRPGRAGSDPRRPPVSRIPVPEGPGPVPEGPRRPGSRVAGSAAGRGVPAAPPRNSRPPRGAAPAESRSAPGAAASAELHIRNGPRAGPATRRPVRGRSGIAGAPSAPSRPEGTACHRNVYLGQRIGGVGSGSPVAWPRHPGFVARPAPSVRRTARCPCGWIPRAPERGHVGSSVVGVLYGVHVSPSPAPRPAGDRATETPAERGPTATCSSTGYPKHAQARTALGLFGLPPGRGLGLGRR